MASVSPLRVTKQIDCFCGVVFPLSVSLNRVSVSISLCVEWYFHSLCHQTDWLSVEWSFRLMCYYMNRKTFHHQVTPQFPRKCTQRFMLRARNLFFFFSPFLKKSGGPLRENRIKRPRAGPRIRPGNQYDIKMNYWRWKLTGPYEDRILAVHLAWV